MQVDKNELHLATYNNLWACFICMFMEDKVFLETRNNVKLVFATTLCSSFFQWILCSLYLYVCADVCLMIHVLWFLIGALFTMFHYNSLMNSYLIFATFNETLLMRLASLLTLVSNYLNKQYCHYNAYFRSHFSSRWFHCEVCHQETIHWTLTEWSYHKGGLSLYPNIEAVLLMSFTEVYLRAVI